MPEVDATVEYRDIPGFPGYKVGNDGTVWSCRERGGSHQWRFSSQWAEMRPKLEHTGYYRLTLRKGRRSYTRAVHHLVLMAFISDRPRGMQCRHLNGVRTDNRLANLAWGTALENHADKKTHGTTAKGQRNGNSRLAAAQVLRIRELAAEGVHLKSLNLQFGVSDVTIYHIVNRHTWRHL